jgi:hypothetical protein
MLQPGQRAHLRLDAQHFATLGVESERLHRHRPPEHLVRRTVDIGHAAGTETLSEPIPIRDNPGPGRCHLWDIPDPQRSTPQCGGTVLRLSASAVELVGQTLPGQTLDEFG